MKWLLHKKLCGSAFFRANIVQRGYNENKELAKAKYEGIYFVDIEVHMRKIAIVADGWRRLCNYDWICGCRRYISEHQLDSEVYVFSSFGNFSKDEKHNDGEYNIFSLPDFREFDGIILEITNVSKRKNSNRIIELIKKSGVPAVSLLEKVPGLYHAGVDNYSVMKELVEHLVTEHGCHKINYIGGPQYVSENHDRLQAYIDVLQRHGILVEQDRILHRDYEVMTGAWAFDRFLEMGQKVDAFVCANDNIAVGVCHRAEELGYRVPGDFLVTGFDDFDKASYYKPRITTVSYIREDIAYAAMDLLHHIWNGHKVTESYYALSHPVYQGSCGCKAKHPKKRSHYVINHIFQEVREADLHNELMELKRGLLECTSYEEMSQRLSKCLLGLCCNELYVFMNTDIVEAQNIDAVQTQEEAYITEGYPDDMTLLFAHKDGDVSGNIKKNANELLPAMWDKKEDGFHLFLPIHFREREVGYLVLGNCDYMLDNQFVFDSLSAFSEALEYLHGKIVLRRANNKLSKLYILDSLTGLYNRMAYTELAEPLYEKCKEKNIPLTIMFIDADHLKYINDEFGHDMGNIAIRAIAEAIRACCPSNGVAMRYGGDEFVAILPDYDADKAGQLNDDFPKVLSRVAQNYKEDFPIEASFGYAVVSDFSKPLNDYINEADEKMYAHKKARRAERQ